MPPTTSWSPTRMCRSPTVCVCVCVCVCFVVVVVVVVVVVLGGHNDQVRKKVRETRDKVHEAVACEWNRSIRISMRIASDTINAFDTARKAHQLRTGEMNRQMHARVCVTVDIPSARGPPVRRLWTGKVGTKKACVEFCLRFVRNKEERYSCPTMI